MDFSEDFDMPSLFGSSAYEGYDAKETARSHLSPSDLPLPDMDDMYKISPGTPVIDDVSVQTSPFHADDSVFPTWWRSMPTGLRGLTRTSHPSLWYLTAHLSSLTSIVSSSAPHKEILATFARKRAQSLAPGEVEGALNSHPKLSLSQ